MNGGGGKCWHYEIFSKSEKNLGRWKIHETNKDQITRLLNSGPELSHSAFYQASKETATANSKLDFSHVYPDFSVTPQKRNCCLIYPMAQTLGLGSTETKIIEFHFRPYI
jgi:hypothetical protein